MECQYVYMLWKKFEMIKTIYIYTYIYKMGIDIIKQGWNSSNERIFLNAKFFINIIKI